MSNYMFVTAAFVLTWLVLLGTLGRVTRAHRRARAMLAQMDDGDINLRDAT